MFITYEIDTYVECFIYMSFTYPQKKKKSTLYFSSRRFQIFFFLADSDFTLAAFKA